MPQGEASNNLRHLNGVDPSAYESIWASKPFTSEYYDNLVPYKCLKVIPINSSVTATELSIADLLSEDGYSIDEKDIAGITEFILANPQLIQDLKNAPDLIRSFFKRCELKLELYTDTEEEYCNLNILILNDYPLEVAFAMEQELFSKYFMNLFVKHKGKLNVRETSLN